MNPRKFLLFILLPLFCHAQKSEIGLNTGFGLVTHRGVDIPNFFLPGGGVTLGINYRFNFDEHFAIYFNPLLEYRSRNASANVVDPNGFAVIDATFRRQSTSVGIPLMINFHLGNKFRLELNAGGYYNYSILEKRSPNFFSSTIFLPPETDTPKDDAGAVFGIGFSSRFSEYCFFQLEFRNYIGLMDHAPQLANFSSFENFHAIIIGLSFPVGPKIE